MRIHRVNGALVDDEVVEATDQRAGGQVGRDDAASDLRDAEPCQGGGVNGDAAVRFEPAIDMHLVNGAVIEECPVIHRDGVFKN